MFEYQNNFFENTGDEEFIFRTIWQKIYLAKRNKTRLTTSKTGLHPCCDRIVKAMCITSSSGNSVEFRLAVFHDWTNEKQQLMKSVQNWPTTRVSSIARASPNLTSICKHNRNWYSLVEKFSYIRRTDLISSDYHLFRSLQITLMRRTPIL